jgi:hypothetical protein
MFPLITGILALLFLSILIGWGWRGRGSLGALLICMIWLLLHSLALGVWASKMPSLDQCVLSGCIGGVGMLTYSAVWIFRCIK